MKSILVLTALCTFFVVGVHAQTSILNLDDDPITSPNNYNTNVRSWGYLVGTNAGCNSEGWCYAGGNMSHTSYYSVDGSSLQMNLLNENCPSSVADNPDEGCYSNADFTDHIYQGSACTACNATQFTLDLYGDMNSVGNAASQAVEFTIEQDIPSARISGDTDRYIYSWQCRYKGTGAGYWYYWDESAYEGGGNGWVEAQDTNGDYVPCQPYTAGTFTHYYFHFQRLTGSTPGVEFLDFTEVNSSGTTYYQFDKTANLGSPIAQQDWADGLFTAIQLDGDNAQDPYSVWADKWTVAYQ